MASLYESSQQEANKIKKIMKSLREKKQKEKTKTKTVKKTKKVKEVKEVNKPYHFDDLVKSNILSFIPQPPLVKIVSKKSWKANKLSCCLTSRDVSRHVDTKATKKALGISGAGKFKVFVEYDDGTQFDERAQTQIVYKYDVCCCNSHPLGKETEWGFTSRHPQGTAYVVYN